LSEESQEKIKHKVEKLSRLFERLIAIEVTVDVEKEDAPMVEIRVSAEHKHDFVATDQSPTLMTALDGAFHKVEQQLRKYKEKLQNHHRDANPRQAAASLEPEPSGE
jgi:putative sigma-54 modulation protein